MAVMRITLYNEDSEPIKEYTRGFVPWKLLKRAVKLSNSMNKDNVKEEDLDELAGLVCEVFNNQFSIDDLNNQADVGEMMTVLTAIIGTASQGMTGGAKTVELNPTTPG